MTMNKPEFTKVASADTDINPQFGDVMICRFPNTHSDGTPDGTYKIRPVFIGGGGTGMMLGN